MQPVPLCHGPRARFLASLIFSLTLAACGGGSDTPSRLDGIGDGGQDGTPDEPVEDTSPAQMGRGTGENFVPGEIEVSDTQLDPGESATLTVFVIDAQGEPTLDQVTVTFTSDCLADNLASLSDTDTEGGTQATTTNGRAQVVYLPTGCEGEDTITARTTGLTENLMAEATLTVSTPEPNSFEFVSAEPEVIFIEGSGGTTTSRVTFRVNDIAGNPLRGVTVDFALDSTAGGASLVNDSAVTDDEGLASTQVNSGTVAQSVTVRATSAELPGQETQSSELSIGTGVPDQNSTSLSATVLSPVAWNFDGVESQITIRLADAFENPPVPGTSVSFTTSGGRIEDNCNTDESGNCTVTWNSQNPRPVPQVPFILSLDPLGISCPGAEACRSGRVQILAHARGNESFIDLNNNGLYDGPSIDAFNTEPDPADGRCVPNNPASTKEVGDAGCDDLPAAYLDANFNRQRDGGNPGEEFFEEQGDGMFSFADGVYNGLLCNSDDPSVCNTDPVKVRDQRMLIMACQTPLLMGDVTDQFPFLTGALPGQPRFVVIGPGESVGFNVLLADCNGNGMAPGTTVEINTENANKLAQSGTSLSGALAQNSEPSLININLTADDTDPVSGQVFIDVTSPTPEGSVTTTTQGITLCSAPIRLQGGRLPLQPATFDVAADSQRSFDVQLATCLGEGVPAGTKLALNTGQLDNLANSSLSITEITSDQDGPITVTVTLEAEAGADVEGTLFIQVTSPSDTGFDRTTTAGPTIVGSP